MSDADLARYQRADIVGHRPTWTMGTRRSAAGFREEGGPAAFQDPLGIFNGRFHQQARQEPQRPKFAPATMKALDELGLDDKADSTTIKTRYKELVKKWHPDANGGDRGTEEKLREIIRAYTYLKSVKLV